MKTLDQPAFCERLSGCLVFTVPRAAVMFGHDRRQVITVFAPYLSGGAMILDEIHVAEPLEYDDMVETCGEWLNRERRWGAASEILDR